MNTSIDHLGTPECPFVITAEQAGSRLEEWLVGQASSVRELLLLHKAVLFRGFGNDDGLRSISSCLFEELLTYRYRSTPRTNLGQFVYTATEYPRHLAIPQHCENSYQLGWPMKLLFHCVTPADSGGRTPLADVLKVTATIDPAVREEFERRKVMYVRNYRAGVDLPWEEVFGTSQKGEVERYCKEQLIELEWTADGMRTTQVCQATARHPITGANVWFNQAHLFHISALDKASQEVMLAFFMEEGLPRNAYFGDGGRIDPDMLDHVRAAFDSNKIHFDWQRDDVLLVDNMQVSHGREPYEGERKVLVCMAEPYSPADAVVDGRGTETQIVTLHV